MSAIPGALTPKNHAVVAEVKLRPGRNIESLRNETGWELRRGYTVFSAGSESVPPGTWGRIVDILDPEEHPNKYFVVCWTLPGREVTTHFGFRDLEYRPSEYAAS